LLRDDDFVSGHKETPTAFTRQRKLSFAITSLFLLNFVKGSLYSELDHFFQQLHQTDSLLRYVTPSAFSQARDKIKASAFIALNRALVRNVYATHAATDWKGHRLLAIDTTSLLLPKEPELLKHFGGVPDGKMVRPAARLSCCVDVNNSITIDAELAPHPSAERELALHHLKQTTDNDVILYDRGYFAFWFLAIHYQQQRHFCARVPLNACTAVKNFAVSRKKDDVISLTPGHHLKEKYRSLSLPFVPRKVRAIKVVLKTGEIEILLTNLLDKDRYPASEFEALYARRWGVETDFDFKKNLVQIENFSGTSVKAIYQDVYAKVFTLNITHLSVMAAQKIVNEQPWQRRREYRVNVSYAISTMKHLLVKLWVKRDAQIIEKYLHALSKTTEACRPHRSFPRRMRTVSGFKPKQNRKMAA
jgi:hypothetical protein